MTDVLTKKQRSYNMSMIKGRNTQPELKLRKLLYSKGIRGYRIHSKLMGKPDIVFPQYKVIIFIDGCFWHKCPKCFVKPATRTAFWMKKISGNVKRDKMINRSLIKSYWKVIRVWEHEVKRDHIRVVNKIIQTLKHRHI